MQKIDLDEIEASLGYLEDWKKFIAELRAARKVVELAKAKPTLCSDRLKALGEAIKEYEKFGGENFERSWGR